MTEKETAIYLMQITRRLQEHISQIQDALPEECRGTVKRKHIPSLSQPQPSEYEVHEYPILYDLEAYVDSLGDQIDILLDRQSE